MLLYFLRHAEAEDIAQSDAARKLTLKGKQQIEKLAKFCNKAGIRPEVILSSPITRSLQTAKSMGRKLGKVEVIPVKWLACGMSPDTFHTEIRAYGKFSEIFVVGHEPDFSATISSLLKSSQSSVINVRKCSLTCVNLLNLSSGSGMLEYSIPARLL